MDVGSSDLHSKKKKTLKLLTTESYVKISRKNTSGLVLRLDVEQALQEGMVIGGLEPWRTPAVADVSIERGRSDDKAKSVNFRQIDPHLLPAAALSVASRSGQTV